MSQIPCDKDFLDLVATLFLTSPFYNVCVIAVSTRKVYRLKVSSAGNSYFRVNYVIVRS
jgi:hypothetical protein